MVVDDVSGLQTGAKDPASLTAPPYTTHHNKCEGIKKAMNRAAHSYSAFA